MNSFVLNDHQFHAVRCIRDGMMWLDPQPTYEFYQELYSKHYHETGVDDPLDEQATKDVLSNPEERKRIGVLRLAQIENFVQEGSLLEIGFGSGALLEEAVQRGWSVTGLELDQGCVDRMLAQGILAKQCDLLDFQGAIDSFDVIGMYSVIEHTLDPIAYLKKAFELLKTNGILVLRLPETDSEGPTASLIAHTYHFNAHTIMVLLRRCGYEVLQIDSFGLWEPVKYQGGLWNMNVVSRKPSVKNSPPSAADGQPAPA